MYSPVANALRSTLPGSLDSSQRISLLY
ncbi:hypothetical protein A2U01_0063080, partial [Trifolium medium]|nr:hypothetical protein [Trifolium medium]